MIKLSGVCKSFGEKKVLDDLSLNIPNGSIFGLVGINGAGKSTLLRLLAGVYKVDSGSITYNDINVYDNEIVKQDIFFLPDDPYYNINTRAIDMFELYKIIYNADSDLFYKYMNIFKLDPLDKINNFSKGMRRQVFIALAISVKPKYLLLDEAFDGLDPLARLTLKRALIDLLEENECSVIISSHSLRELEDFCDSFGILDGGKIINTGVLSDQIEKIHKYQIVFEKEVEESLFSSFNAVHLSKLGRVVHVVLKGDAKEIEEKIAKLNPIVVDKIAIDFEELFIYEVESRGYLK